jgi:peptidoglycan/LPS O-acetylase OafA/YrhL
VAEPFELGYRPALDGMRGFAVLAVMLVHATTIPFKGGFIGVDVFLVLSGFLITLLLLQEWDRNGRVNLRSFCLRRALRLLPALVALLIVYVIAGYLFLAKIFVQRPADYVIDALIVLFYASNWTNALGLERPQLLGHAWSLAVEGQFYILWPMCLIGLARIVRDKGRILAITLVLAAVVYLHRLQLLVGGASVWRLHLGLDTRLDTLLAGCALAIALSAGLVPRGKRFRVLANSAALAAAAGLVALAVVADWYQPWVFTLVFPLVALCTVLLIVKVIVVPGGVLSRILELPPIVWTGRISYGLYLWHYPIFRTLQQMGYRAPLVLAVGGALTFASATLSYYALERPLLRRRPEQPGHADRSRMRTLTGGS